MTRSDSIVYIVIVCLFIAVSISILSEFIIPILILSIISIVLVNKGKTFFLPLIIVSLLSVTSEFFEEFRLYVVLISIIVLFYFFVKRFGLELDQYPKLPKEISWFLLFLFVTLILSTLQSSHLIVSSIATIRLMLFFLIIYFFYSFLVDESNIYIYIYALLLVVMITGIPMFIDLYTIGIRHYFQRIFLSEIIDLSGSLAFTGFTIFFITAVLLFSFFYFEKFRSNNIRYLLAVLFLINLILLILANSRGGILAAIIGITFVLYKVDRRLLFRIFFSSIVILPLFLLIFPNLIDVIDTYLRLGTVGERQIYWQSGIDAINNNPIFGSGPDTFDREFFNYAPSTIMRNYRPESLMQGKPHPHNFFLFFTAENGILGFIVGISFFYVICRLCQQTLELTKNKGDYFVLSVAITGICLAMFIRSFIEVTGYLLYGFITRDLPFWLILSILVSIKMKFSSD